MRTSPIDPDEAFDIVTTPEGKVLLIIMPLKVCFEFSTFAYERFAKRVSDVLAKVQAHRN